MVKYDARTKLAVDRLYDLLPGTVVADLRSALVTAAADAEHSWACLKEGSSASVPGSPGAAVVADAGEHDGEHPHAPQRQSAPKIQSEICAVVDGCIRNGLKETFQASQRFSDINRLEELSHPRVNHSWIWALRPNHGATLSDAEYVETIRLRLGTAGPTEPFTCAQCDRNLLDSASAHALCCAPGSSTKGHYAVVRKIFDVVQQLDHGAETEAVGLIPSAPTLRPADLLTTAASSGRAAALDVRIASPDAAHAGTDCTETMHAAKLAKYANHQAALERQNIV